MIGVSIFAVALLLLLFGFPVAFTFAGIGIAFVILFADPSQLAQIPYRIYSNWPNNYWSQWANCLAQCEAA